MRPRMLYHVVPKSKLCAVHCANIKFFSEFDLAALAFDVDYRSISFSPHSPLSILNRTMSPSAEILASKID
ncbi:hypothetical protein JHK85_018962 [Glycine max]|nr:hypothetical protein JHK85_018962 [Glycine max]